MSKQIKIWLGTSFVAFSSLLGTAYAQEGGSVAAAATTFASQWATDAAVIGGVLIAAAFIAIGYKWVKGMVFG